MVSNDGFKVSQQRIILCNLRKICNSDEKLGCKLYIATLKRYDIIHSSST